jgi:hypothetical protein
VNEEIFAQRIREPDQARRSSRCGKVGTSAGMTAPSSAEACRMYVTLKQCDGGRHQQSVTVRCAGGGVFEAPTTSTIAHADDWRWGDETAGLCSILMLRRR